MEKSAVLPNAAAAVNTDLMTPDEIHAKLQSGLAHAESGRIQDAQQAFDAFQERL